MATPAEVRKELKKMGLSLDVEKRENFWYVQGEETFKWDETCLHTRYFDGDARFWANFIKGMQEDFLKSERKKVAEQWFAEADFDDIDHADRFVSDGNFFSCRVYWVNPDGGDTIAGSVGVEFEPNSTKIIDNWHQ